MITDIDNDASGQQIKKEVIKTEKFDSRKKLNVNQFNVLVGLISSGDPDSNGEEWDIERAKKSFNLSSEQLKTLKSIS